MAGLDARQALHLGVRTLDLGQDPARPADELIPGIGHRHVACGALNERQAELLLEPANLLGQRRLGDVLALGGTREIAFLGQRDEIAKLA